MTSTKQIKANRRNAQRSTGPRTARGKQMTRLNALKHGLRAEEVVIPGEDPEEFEALHNELRNDLEPAGSIEEILVEQIAVHIWRLRRISRFEAAIILDRYLSTEEDRAEGRLNALKIEESRERAAEDGIEYDEFE